MPAKPDYYKALGVSPDASLKDIKAAYRTLAKKLHPDMGGSADALASVNEAADVLTDPKRREAYDLERRLDKAKPGAASAGSRGRTPTPEPGPERPRQKVTVSLCEFCDTLNRVKDDPDFVPANCGHCGRPLGKAGHAASAPEPPKAAPKEPAAAAGGKDKEELDSYAKILSDAANQLFGGGLKHVTKGMPGADKILEGLQEMADHLASRAAKGDTPPGDRVHERLGELEDYLKRLKRDHS